MSQPLPPPVLQRYYAETQELSEAESELKKAWANRNSLGDHLIDVGDGISYEKTEWIRNNVGLVIADAVNKLHQILATYPGLGSNGDLQKALQAMHGEALGFSNDYFAPAPSPFGTGCYNNVAYADQKADDESTEDSELGSASSGLVAQVRF